MPRLKSGTSLELRVSFIEIKSYNINLDYNASLGNVTATTSIGIVTSAAENSKVTLLFAPKSGYTVDYSTISVTDASGAAVRFNKNDNSFFMPDSNVTVKVNFKTDLNTVYVTPSDNTLDNTAQKGMISVLVNGAKYTESQFSYSQSLGKFYVPSTVKAGSIVTVINESSTGYVLDSETPITVKSSDASIPVEMVDRDKFTFVMPNADVTITPVYTEDLYNISTVATDKGTLNLPKQASYIDTLSIAADTIVAKPGYELDKLLVTYTDHKGIQHRDEEVDLAVGFKPVGEGIPKSEVVFEAVFKPALNPIAINYIYNSAPSNRNFAIDLYLDSKLVEGIQRDPNGSMDILAIDTANNYGLPTGATVRIARQTENQDANFSIKNMWIMHNGNAIEPKYENNQYFFTVPFVDSKLPLDLVLNVQYGTENDEGFKLNVTELEGTTTAINVNARPATMAQPNDNIALSFFTPAGQEVTQVVFKYKNTSGDEITKEYAVDNNRFDTWSCPEHPITSLPKDGIVTVSYTVSAAAHKVAYDDVNGGTAQFIVDNVAILEDADVAVGKVVTVQINAIGMAAKSIEAKCGETTLPVTATEDGKFQFTMPDGNVVVKAYFESTSYVLNTEFVGNGSGNVVYKVGETEYANGSIIPAGSSVSIIATPDAGSYVSAVSSNVTSVDGKYSIEMPNTDTTITVTFTKVSNGISYSSATSGSTCEFFIDGSTTAMVAGETVPYGSTVLVKPSTISNYTISAIEVKCGEAPVEVVNNNNGTWTFIMPLGNAHVTSTYTKAAFAIAVEKSGNGTVGFMVNGAPNDGSAIPHGTEVTVVAAPDAGNSLKELLVNGAAQASGYAFTMPAGNVAVKATFDPAKYTIKFKGFAEGSATPSFDINGAAEPVISLDTPIKATVDGDYALESVVANYKGLDGSDVTDNMTITKSDSEPGVYLLALNNVPTNNAEIFVTTRFSEIKSSYKLEDVSGVDAAVAELKFYATKEGENREPITEALEGSKVYAEITVKTHEKKISNDKILWDGNIEWKTMDSYKVTSDKTAVFKFEFDMPSKDTEVSYQLADATITFAYETARVSSVSSPISVGTPIVVTAKNDGSGYKDVCISYNNGANVQRDSAVEGDVFDFTIGELPLHDVTNNYLNFVQLHVIYNSDTP